MDVIGQLKDKEIHSILGPTVAAFTPLLESRRESIEGIPKKSFKYGTTERHQLDIFYPLQNPSPAKNKTPILFFVYGGGFTTGDRSISPETFGLVYACLGAFFARKGYIVVIPDYRLVPHVKFPGPAEDVRDAIRWVTKNPQHLVSAGCPSPDVGNIVVMGHSAGAAHVSTMFFHTGVLSSDDEIRTNVKAIILLSGPYSLNALTASSPHAPACIAYWGSLEEAKENDPHHLFRRLPGVIIAGLPTILMVEGEHEPDWLVEAGNILHLEYTQKTGEEPKRIVGKGHNHISLSWALSTGEGEEWADEVTEMLGKLLELD